MVQSTVISDRVESPGCPGLLVECAEVESIDGLSAHADRNELLSWVRRLGGPIRRAFVVHGEPPALEAMAQALREAGVRDVRVPRHGESFDL